MPHLNLGAAAALEPGGLALLLVQVALILASAWLVALATVRLGQPLVVAEIVAGIALGPSLLGWIRPGALALLFPASSLPTLGLLSQLGLVLFMFMIGLELDVALLRAKASAFVLISHTSIVVPFGLGAGAAYWLWPEYSVSGVPLGSFMLFMGEGGPARVRLRGADGVRGAARAGVRVQRAAHADRSLARARALAARARAARARDARQVRGQRPGRPRHRPRLARGLRHRRTRGLMELVVLNLGMDLGVISPQVFTMLVLMALVTTVATTPILKRVYPSPEPVADPSSLRLGLTR